MPPMVVKDFEKCSISRQTLLMLLMQTLQVNELLPSDGVPFRPVLPSLYAPSDSSAVLSEAAVSWMDLTHAVSPQTVTAQVLWQGSDTSAEASQKLVASALLSDRLDLTGFFFFFS